MHFRSNADTFKNINFIIFCSLLSAYIICVIGKYWCLAIGSYDVALGWDITRTILGFLLAIFITIYISIFHFKVDCSTCEKK